MSSNFLSFSSLARPVSNYLIDSIDLMVTTFFDSYESMVLFPIWRCHTHLIYAENGFNHAHKIDGNILYPIYEH